MSPHNANLPVPGSDPQDPGHVPTPAAGATSSPEALVEITRQDWYDGPLVPPPGLSSGPSALTLLKGLQRRWWVAAGIGLVLAAGAAAAAWLLLEPKYTAIAQVRIRTVPPWILTPRIDTSGDRNEFLTYQRVQVAQMRSRFVLNAARKRDEVKNLELIQRQPDPIAFLEEEVKIDFKDGDEYHSITMLSSNPEEAKAIVNAVREEYFNEVVKKERETRVARKKELEDIVNTAKTELNKQLTTLHGMADQLGTNVSGALAQKQVDLLTLLGEKKRQLGQVQFDLVKTTTRLKSLEARRKSLAAPKVGELELSQALEADPVAKNLMLRLSKLEVILAGYERTARNPNESGKMQAQRDKQATEKSLDRRRNELTTALSEGLQQKAESDQDSAMDQLRTEAVSLSQQEKDLSEQVKTLSADTEKLGKSSTELERLKDEVGGERQRVEKYENELAALDIELRPNLEQRVTAYQEALVLKRNLMKQVAVTAIAPLAVLFFVCFVVAWWECRARRIHTADEVATGLGMRVVGAVPQLPNAGQMVGADEEEDVHVHSLLESIDGIRTLLLRDAGSLRVVMVTSAVSGEGKTTLASHLASSLARAGRRTLLIDCDLRRPSAHQLFEVPQQPGFSEALLGEVHVAEATMSTALDGLWLIPAGIWDREVIQALAKEGMRKLFEKLRNEYDFIVIDSHPVLPATDSLLIGQHVDAVILSLMRDVSTAPKVYAAYQRLATLGIRIFGAVVSGLPEQDAYAGGYQYAAPVART